MLLFLNFNPPWAAKWSHNHSIGFPPPLTQLAAYARLLSKAVRKNPSQLSALLSLSMYMYSLPLLFVTESGSKSSSSFQHAIIIYREKSFLFWPYAVIAAAATAATAFLQGNHNIDNGNSFQCNLHVTHLKIATSCCSSYSFNSQSVITTNKEERNDGLA